MLTTVHDFEVEKSEGKPVSLNEYKGNILVIVNTATKCGLAPQFKSLESLYQDYKDHGVKVLGFPSNQFMNQEPVSDEEMSSTCEINFGVTFPLMKKINVNGKEAHPLYKHLKSEKSGTIGSEIKWNFTKFLVDEDGNVLKRYGPNTSPDKIREDIDSLLK
ncbi:glutathione peroxidase [Alkalicoccus halolimnae]|uniref:Glutathione peroxidase n=1 Tax=Alkalicoccus halolimnae TaxID=1667239 RepID=A0A5C7FD91_9BACI|nr:glutathione peroxidase [Alkalicoccus halolimnae]TXF82766.1 glutathione peroxidase [Alkalicoccus halolimnae]